MQTVVRAADARGAMQALVERLGPQAVLLATRRLANGVEMTGAAAPPPADPGAAARFRGQAQALGFAETLIDAAVAAGPAASAADIWVRFAARIERRVRTAPPPHADATAIGVVGPADARVALLDALAAAMARDKPAIVAMAGSPAAAVARSRRLKLVTPDMRWGIARMSSGGGRLLLDLGDAGTPLPLTALVETQAAERGLVRLVAVGADDPDPALAGRCDALAMVGEAARPGAAISLLLDRDLPLAYAAAPGAALAVARASQISRRIVAALARLGPGAG